MNETKTCTKCGASKSLGSFYKDKSGKNGLTAQCKACTKKRVKAYHAKYPEKGRRRANKYYHDNIQEEKRKRKEYYLKNRDKELARAAKWREENHEAFVASYP